jgi:SAM-dependent methyltransferase
MVGMDAGCWQMAELVCPEDRARLRLEPDRLRCEHCGTIFAIEGGIPHLLGEGSSRWRRAQAYELGFWGKEDSVRQAERTEQNRRGAEGLVRLFDEYAGVAWRERGLQIGPANEGEIHYLPVRERYAVEPLALPLAERGLLTPGAVRWIAGQGERLPFPDGHFSLILITNVIDHVADPWRVLTQMRRCLRPGGLVWLTCQVTPGVLIPAFAFFNRLRWSYFKGHPWYFSRAKLDRMCRQAGFRVLRASLRRHEAGELGRRGRFRRRLKPLILQDRQLLLAADADEPQRSSAV